MSVCSDSGLPFVPLPLRLRRLRRVPSDIIVADPAGAVDPDPRRHPRRRLPSVDPRPTNPVRFPAAVAEKDADASAAADSAGTEKRAARRRQGSCDKDGEDPERGVQDASQRPLDREDCTLILRPPTTPPSSPAPPRRAEPPHPEDNPSSNSPQASSSPHS